MKDFESASAPERPVDRHEARALEYEKRAQQLRILQALAKIVAYGDVSAHGQPVEQAIAFELDISGWPPGVARDIADQLRESDDMLQHYIKDLSGRAAELKSFSRTAGAGETSDEDPPVPQMH